MPKINFVTEADVRGKRVLLRTGLNAPIDEQGNPTDAHKLEASLPTLRWLCQQGARVVVLAHLGRSGDSLRGVAAAVAKLAPELAISFFDGSLEDAHSAVENLKEGSVVILENVRRSLGEESNDPELAKAYAALGDVYVNDAFADSHREHATIVGIPKLLPAYLGLLMQKEIEHLTPALTPPKHALAIIGGAKFETKEPLLTKFVATYEHILLGGALANDMLKARGMPFGASMISDKPVPVELAEDERIFVPTDVIVFDSEVKGSREAFVTDTRATEAIVDIGSRTSLAWSEHIANASLVLWNGPLGVYEKGYTMGTDALAKAVAEASGKAIVGGGDTLAALAKYEFDESRVFLSTGGGAMLEFLSAGTLVGIEAVKR